MLRKLFTAIGFTFFWFWVFFIILSKSISVDRYYLKDDKGNVIIYQGMIHTAESFFYYDVNKFIKEHKQKGFKHLYELVVPNKQTNEINKIMVTDVYFDLVNTSFKLRDQNKYFKIDIEDIHADVTTSELECVILKKTNCIENNNYKFVSNIINAEERYKTSFYDFYFIFTLKTSLWFYSDESDSDFNKYIINYRNDRLVDFIEEEIAKGNKKLVITYGHLHFDHLFSILKNKGFYIEKKEKVLAIKNY